jgi:hypothetical protein
MSAGLNAAAGPVTVTRVSAAQRRTCSTARNCHPVSGSRLPYARLRYALLDNDDSGAQYQDRDGQSDSATADGGRW